MAQLYYYKVHETADPNSDIIVEGGAGKIHAFFYFDSNKLKKVRESKNHLIFGMHLCEFMPWSEWRKNEDERLKKEQKKKKPVSKFRKYIDTVERMLDIYGNTIVYKDFDKIEAALNKDGYFISRKHEPKRIVRGSKTSYREVYPECEILTLVRKETIEC